MDQDLPEQLTELFRLVGREHHAAFHEADGFDPEWPAWYAAYLHEKLAELLNAKFTKSELIYLLVTVDQEQRTRAPGGDWAAYYTRFFIDRYT